ncbi:MAG: F0F1 ATP synthase subunit gamma [Vulcanimicrobiota bacterium]
MESLETVKNQLNTAKELHSVVKTMKALAAVSIRQFQEAVKSLKDYNQAVNLGFQALISTRPMMPVNQEFQTGKRAGIILFGSDHGMCGQFNEIIISFFQHKLEELDLTHDEIELITVGKKVTDRCRGLGMKINSVFSVPGSAPAITYKTQLVMPHIEEWYSLQDVNTIFLVHNQYRQGASFKPELNRLLPLDETWFKKLEKKRWPTNMIPLYTINWNKMFTGLLKHYLFASLYTAFADSLASEHASRLASMQEAEKNIKERVENLTDKYHQQRHINITNELLDIVSGYEALTQ